MNLHAKPRTLAIGDTIAITEVFPQVSTYAEGPEGALVLESSTPASITETLHTVASVEVDRSRVKVTTESGRVIRFPRSLRTVPAVITQGGYAAQAITMAGSSRVGTEAASLYRAITSPATEAPSQEAPVDLSTADMGPGAHLVAI